MERNLLTIIRNCTNRDKLIKIIRSNGYEISQRKDEKGKEYFECRKGVEIHKIYMEDN